MALDLEPELLAALASGRATRGSPSARWRRRGGLRLDAAFRLIIVPMQTVQLLPERGGFLAAAAAHLAPGGLLAIAITGAIEDFDAARTGILPTPDVGTRRRLPLRLPADRRARAPAATRIERVRRTFGPTALAAQEDDVIELAHLTVEALEEEGRAAGLTPEPARTIDADRRARRLRGGAAACLSTRCASARSIPT